MKNVLIFFSIIIIFNTLGKEIVPSITKPEKAILVPQNKPDIVDKLYLTGKDFFQKKDYVPALKNWNQAIFIEEQKKYPRKKLLTVLYYYIGTTNLLNHKYKNARKQLEVALSYFQEKEHDDFFPILLYNELSNAYQYTEEYKKALQYALLALMLQKKKYGENDIWTGAYSVGVAVMYHKLKNKPMAIKYMREAINIFRKFPDKKKEVERLTQHLKKWTTNK